MHRRPVLLCIAVCLLAAPAASSPREVAGSRLFSSQSPFNTPITRAAPTDPRSLRYLPGLVAAANDRGFTIAAYDWSVPVYYPSRATPRRTVRLTAPGTHRRTLRNVPIPQVARPDTQADGTLMLLDRRSGCEFDFWQARREADGSWSASWGNAITMRGSGIFRDGASTRASGFALGAGLIFPGELRRGRIDHALYFSYPYTKSGGPVAPATRSDGRLESETGKATGSPPLPVGALPLPEGARLQLDPTLDLGAWKLRRWQRTIARALQRYGMILSDTGGAVGLAAASGRPFRQDPYRDHWPSGTLFPAMPTDLLLHMRVLKLGRQRPQRRPFSPSRCARFGHW
jgi:hypothetical protein